MGAVEVEKILTIVPELLEIPYSRSGHLMTKKLTFYMSISRSQVMQMILSLRMTIS